MTRSMTIQRCPREIELLMPYLLLTGATGLLGGYLLRDCLRQNLPVAVIVRPTPALSARRRVDQVLAPFETERAMPRPVVLEGDLSRPGLGLSDDDRQWLQTNCRRVLHSAASISFHREEKSGEPYRTNVDGTRNLLDLCREAGIEDLHHVSTAYVCGRRSGHVLESELDVGQQQGNDYEQSKVAAEKMVHAAGFRQPPTIYRPSIIVGDSQTGYTTTFHGFYTPLQVAWMLSKAGALPATPNWFLSELGLTGQERKNIVPVDWVSRVIVELLQNRAAHGRTYHLTCSNPPSAQDIDSAIGDAIRARLNGSGEGVSRTAGTRLPESIDVRQHMDVYRAYFRDHPEFDTSQLRQAAPHLPCPAVDRTLLTRMASYALEANFGWPRTPPPAAPIDWRAEGDNHTVQGPTCNLEITGAGGGAWSYSLGNNGVSRGRAENPAATIRLRSDTLAALTARDIDLDDALLAGRVLIAANSSEHAQAAAELLSRLIMQQQSAERRNGASYFPSSRQLQTHGETIT